MQPTEQAGRSRRREGVTPAEALLVWHLEPRGLEVRTEGSEALARKLWPEGEAPARLAALLGRLCLPGQVSRLGDLLEQVAADGLPRSLRHSARGVEGDELRLETHALNLGGGNLVGTTALAAADDAEAKLRVLLDAQPLGLLEFDEQGDLTQSEGRPASWAGREGRAPWLDADLKRAREQGRHVGGGELGGRRLAVHYGLGELPGRPRSVLAIALETGTASDVPVEGRTTVHDLYEVLDAVADSISLQDPTGRVTFMNRAGLRSLGLSSLKDLPFANQPGRIAEHYQSVDDEGRPMTGADMPGRIALSGRSSEVKLTRFRVPGHEERWSLFRALPLFGPDGRVRMAVNVWTDVTDMQHARDELRRQTALLRASSEASLDASLIVSPERKWLYFNQRFKELWGFDRELLESGDDLRAIQALEKKLVDPEAFGRRVAELYETPDRVSRDEIALIDGRLLERYSAPARGEGGEFYGRVWFFRDITDRRRHEERERALREEQGARAAAEAARVSWEFIAEVSRSLAGLLDIDAIVARVASLSVPRLAEACVVDLVSEDGSLHRAGLAHADPSTAEAASKLRLEVVDPSAPLGVAEVIRTGDAEMMVSGRAPSETRPPNGWSPLGERGPRAGELLQRLGVGAWLVVPLSAHGRRLGAVTFAWRHPPSLADQFVAGELAQRAAISIESALLYQRAQQAVAIRDDFLSVASHEFRTPVTALRLAQQGLLRLAKVDGSSEATVKLLRAVGRHERRLSKLVDMLLDVTRIHGDKLWLELERVDLSAVAHDAATLFMTEAERCGSALTVHAPAPVIGRWDQARLEQVVSNLLANALKYGAGKPVELEVTQRGRTAHLDVRDQGIGIPLESQPMIFERFERAVSSKHYGGLGLGLYIVRGIVRALGGTVSFQSTPSKGSTFSVELSCDGPSPKGAP